MPVRKKTTKRIKIELSGAEEAFLYGKTEKHVNPFEALELEYAIHPKAKARVEELMKIKIHQKL